MLTMRYDLDRQVMWILHEWHDPFQVTLHTIEELASCSGLSQDQLVDTCREHEAQLAAIATRKRKDGELNPDGLVVITSADLNSAYAAS